MESDRIVIYVQRLRKPQNCAYKTSADMYLRCIIHVCAAILLLVFEFLKLFLALFEI